MFDELAEGLTGEQRAAATAARGPLLVLAGAGTGKTTTLTARVSWLVDVAGVAPERVLLLTFTRRAAREMLGRVAAAGLPGAGRVTGGTFHAVAHRLLRRHAAALGLPDGFTLLDAADAADVLDLVREDLGLASLGRRMPRKATLLDLYQRVVATQRPLASVVAGTAPWCAEVVPEIGAVVRGYLKRKRERGLLDLDDLLLHWRAACRDDVLGPRLAGMWDTVLVDEYQDVNALQVDVLRALRPPGADDLTAVGDDAQAVYGFRAASPEHVAAFPADFPGASVVTLTVNHRSTQPLLDLANAVLPRGLVAARPGGSRPTVVHCPDEHDEAAGVAEAVLAAREEGLRLRDQAVLARSSSHFIELELELARRRVPFVKYGGLRHLEAAHVKDLLALLRIADNPADEVAWFRLLQLLDGVGPAGARRALASGSPLAAGGLPPAARVAADALGLALRDTSRGSGLPVGVRAERLRAGIEPALVARYPDAALRLADLDRLVTALVASSVASSATVGSDGSGRTLADLVAELTLDPPASTTDVGVPVIDEDWLVLSTVHSAKGLEWEVVHLLHASDGAFPSDLATGSQAGVEEERRLFYVAVTRPRSSLAVWVPHRWHHRPRGWDDAHSLGQPSRFLGPEAVAACDLVQRAPPAPLPGVELPSRRVEVELDALFG